MTLKSTHCIIEVSGMTIVLATIAIQITILQDIADVYKKAEILETSAEFSTLKMLILQSGLSMRYNDIYFTPCFSFLATKDQTEKDRLQQLCEESLNKSIEMRQEMIPLSERKDIKIPEKPSDRFIKCMYIIGSFMLIVAKYIERMHLKK